jgi:hypothetical protein
VLAAGIQISVRGRLVYSRSPDLAMTAMVALRVLLSSRKVETVVRMVRGCRR